VYVEVPPLKDAVVESIELWPSSIAVGAAEITGATRAELTLTAATEETAPPSESVTWTQ